jgi:hypothetical protein
MGYRRGYSHHTRARTIEIPAEGKKLISPDSALIGWCSLPQQSLPPEIQLDQLLDISREGLLGLKRDPLRRLLDYGINAKGNGDFLNLLAHEITIQ